MDISAGIHYSVWWISYIIYIEVFITKVFSYITKEYFLMKTKQLSISIILFAWLAYLFSYMGRANYGACIVEIVATTGVSRATAGMVTSVFSLFNSFGQIGSGFLLKKIHPVKIIAAELFIVASINLLFPASNSFVIMALLWGINGAMQSTLLCSATKIFMETLKEPWLSKGAVMLNTVGAVGGTLNYVLTWFLIRYATWQTVFFTVSSILFAAGILWVIFMPKFTASASGQSAKASKSTDAKDSARKTAAPASTAGKTSLLSQLTRYGAAFMLAGCFMIGLMRESVSLWIPSYINEVFGLSSSLSIILTVFVPGFQVFGAILGGRLGRKMQNLHFPGCVVFAISGFCMGMLLLAGDFNPFLSVGLFVINAICMTAALTLSLSLFPIRFLAKEHAPMFVGILNFFVHAGDFFASAGIGWLSQYSGWGITFTILCTIAFTASVVYAVGGIYCKRELERR
ncbi:MAG: MFS transporter [Lachnospiraceae bacterium]|nr:MFS transporter [Lachnospiraceae bacterium]